MQFHAPSIGEPSRELPIWMDRVSKWYGRVIGLNDVSLRIEGGVVAVLGPNGAGKSTLMKLLTGQLVPSLGKLRIFGRSVRSPAARRKLGYCPDVDAFYEEMTGREFVEAMVRLSGFTAAESRRRTDEALETVGMANQANKRLRGCSKGMRQRIKLAQAIAHDPELLLLDEPLSGLDPVGREDFVRLFARFRAQGKTLLVSTHVLTEVERIADQVLLIGQGRLLIKGTWDEVARFLEDRPRRVQIGCDRPRDLAAELLRWPGVAEVKLTDDTACELNTRDPGGLCDEVGRLVRERGYRVHRLHIDPQWTDRLFTLMEGS